MSTNERLQGYGLSDTLEWLRSEGVKLPHKITIYRWIREGVFDGIVERDPITKKFLFIRPENRERFKEKFIL